MQSIRYSNDTRIRWGRLALSAISKKSTLAADDHLKLAAESVRVRSYMIQEFGVSESNEVRNPTALYAYIIGNIGMSPTEAALMATNWRNAPREQMLRLRRAKNMIAPLAAIQGILGEYGPIHPDIAAWLTLIPRLP